MSGFTRSLLVTAVASSLCLVPTAAIAASPAPAVQPMTATAAGGSPWVTLSAMTTSSSSAATAAARHTDDDDDHAGWVFPPIAALVVILATIALAIYILTKDDDGDPISPF